MANNRMFLVYRPTGDCVLLGKRLATGWYTPSEDVKSISEKLTELFQKAEKECSEGKAQDDFCVAMELCDNGPLVLLNWAYGISENGTVERLILAEDDQKATRR